MLCQCLCEQVFCSFEAVFLGKRDSNEGIFQNKRLDNAVIEHDFLYCSK